MTLIPHVLVCIVVCSGLLFLLTASLLRTTFSPVASPSSRILISAASLSSVLLHSLHPVHMEVIGWPSAQPYSLGGTFTLLSLLAYSWPSTAQPSRCRTLLSCLLYAAAILSKAACLTAVPAFVLAIDLLRHSRQQGGRSFPVLAGLVADKLPFLLVAAALLSVSVWANRGGVERDADVLVLDLRERLVKAQVE